MKVTYGMLALGLALMSVVGKADMTPVCDRTEAVKKFLEVTVKKTCDAITETDLVNVKRVAVPNKKITELKVGDFSGLPSLEILNIKGNLYKTLPEGLFKGLPKLNTLVLFRTQLEKLPEDFLEGLPEMVNLHVFGNPFTEVSPAILERLAGLKNLKVLDFNAKINAETQKKIREIFPEGGPVQLGFF